MDETAKAWHVKLRELEQEYNTTGEIDKQTGTSSLHHRNTSKLVHEAKQVARAQLNAMMEQNKKDTSSIIANATAQKDKQAAAALAAVSAPMASLPELKELVADTEKAEGKGSKQLVDKACNALAEIFQSDTVIPADRKLRQFHTLESPVLSECVDESKRKTKKISHSHCLLIAAYRLFEDELKAVHARYVAALEVMSRSSLDFLKNRAVRNACDLLISNPEGEDALLRIVVNKLGDPQKKGASKASYLLRTVLSHHPNMKPVIAREVMALCNRPNVPTRAKYYAVVFLHQLPLSHKGSDPQVAKELVHWYVNLFRALMESSVAAAAASSSSAQGANKENSGKATNQKNKLHKNHKNNVQNRQMKAQSFLGIDSRIQRAILTGVNRAFPYVEPNAADQAAKQLEPKLYVVAHSNSIKASLQALSLLKQLQTTRGAASDRFHRSVYNVMLHEGLPSSSQASSFLSLIFKVIKEDTSLERQHAFVKRLLQVALNAPPQFACGVLLLLSELLKERSHLRSAILQPEEQTNAADADRAENGGGSAVESLRYDMRKREPKFANASGACWWELELLGRHGHPSVRAMASSLLGGGDVVYGGDPINDLSMMAFVDKFLNKSRPKRKLNNTPLAQRAAISDEAETHLFAGASTSNPKQEEEAYFRRYYQKMHERKGKRQASTKEGEEESGTEMSGRKYADSNEEDEADRAIDEQEEDADGGFEGEYDYSKLAQMLPADAEDEDELVGVDEEEAEALPLDEDDESTTPAATASSAKEERHANSAENIDYDEALEEVDDEDFDASVSVETGTRGKGPFALADDYSLDDSAELTDGNENEGATGGGVETTVDDLIRSAPSEQKERGKQAKRKQQKRMPSDNGQKQAKKTKR